MGCCPSRGLCPRAPRIFILQRLRWRPKQLVTTDLPPSSPRTRSSRPTLHDLPSAATSPARSSRPCSSSPERKSPSGSVLLQSPTLSAKQASSKIASTHANTGAHASKEASPRKVKDKCGDDKYDTRTTCSAGDEDVERGRTPDEWTKPRKNDMYRKSVHPGSQWPFKEVHRWSWNPTLRFDLRKLEDHGQLDCTEISEVRRVSFHGRFFALKVIDKRTSPQPPEAYTREVLLLQRLCGHRMHPQIVELLGVCETYERMCLLFELCALGRSTDFLQVEAERCPELRCVFYTKPLGLRLEEVGDGYQRVSSVEDGSLADRYGVQRDFILVGPPECLADPAPISCVFRDYRQLITVWNYLVKDFLEAMIYLHQIRIVHGDIKPDNVLVTNAQHGRDFVAKICDFGHAREVGLREVLQGVSGTPGYRPPEVEMGAMYDGFKADIFSAGVTLSAWLALPTAEQKWIIREMTDRDATRRPTAHYALAALCDDVAFGNPVVPVERAPPPSRSLYSRPVSQRHMINTPV